ncbi:MAG: putative ABC transporter permease [Candidatus Coprovivens sp.]
MNLLTDFFLLFIIYSFIGWIIDVVDVLIEKKELVNRGFMVGPYCPIYGCGSLLMIILLGQYKDNPILLFIMAILICSILEYSTSYIMEKLFKARWWDYHYKKFNLNGRICLENCLGFGLLGFIVVCYINPLIYKVIDLIPNNYINIISIILFIIFVTDFVVSFKIIAGFAKVAKSVNKDNTVEITRKVREVLSNRGLLYKRLIKAFNFQASVSLIKNLPRTAINTAFKAGKSVIDVSNKTINKIRKK